MNDHALSAIEAATADAKSLSLSSFLLWKRNPPAHAVILSNFESAMVMSSEEIRQLIFEAGNSLRRLDRLEETLNVVHEMLSRESSAAGEAKEELLANFWTRLGLNEANRRSAEAHIRLLIELGEYRCRARAHVVGALKTLGGIEAEMGELRKRVAAPAIAGSVIPPEVQMRKPFAFLRAAESAH
jgi:hypothetical protein